MCLQHGEDVARKLRSMADGASNKDGGGGAGAMRLVVDMNALRRHNSAETAQFIKRPMDYIAAFQAAAAEVRVCAQRVCLLLLRVNPPPLLAHGVVWGGFLF
jgi:hypothetical protein